MNNGRKKVCAIVDAYSSGSLFAEKLGKLGYECIHIQAAPEITPVFSGSFRPYDFIDNIIHDGDLESTLEKLQRYDPVSLFAGAETGVELADHLSDALRLASNGKDFSEIKRNKYLMHEILREKGLTSIKQIKSSNVKEIAEWCKKTNEWPLVVKPINSAGGDNVRLCNTFEDIEAYCGTILNRKNQMGFLNKEVVVQSYLKGVEYTVDTATCEGVHFVTDIWRVKRNVTEGCGIVEDSMELISPESEEVSALTEYVFKVLEAFHIKYGPAHIEVILNTENGQPNLIELGGRIQGGYMPLLNEKCLEYNQIDMGLFSYLLPGKFKRIASNPYRIVRHGMVVCLISDIEGILKGYKNLNIIRNLDSFFRFYFNVGIGESIKKTTDLFSSPGGIELAHTDKSVLQRELDAIRDIEKEGLFEV